MPRRGNSSVVIARLAAVVLSRKQLANNQREWELLPGMCIGASCTDAAPAISLLSIALSVPLCPAALPDPLLPSEKFSYNARRLPRPAAREIMRSFQRADKGKVSLARGTCRLERTSHDGSGRSRTVCLASALARDYELR